MRYFVEVAGRTVEVDLAPEGARVDGRPVTADLAAVPDGPVRSLLLDGASHRVVARSLGGGKWDLRLRGRRLPVEVVDERTRAIRAMLGAGTGPAGPKPVRAPMPGLVVRVEVAVGDLVRPGHGLVIVEAMKMENELRASRAGRVKTVKIAEGQSVEAGALLVTVE